MSVQLENGFTMIANELLEALMNQKIHGREFRVLLVIMRKTYGFGKKEDQISLSQFTELTGLERKYICDVLNSLENKKMIVRDNRVSPTRYSLTKDYSVWDCTLQGVQLVPQEVIKGSPVRYIQKKEINTKESIVDKSTSIIINGTTYMTEELIYEPLEGSKTKSKYGRATMAVLARKYAELAKIELPETFDASAWSKPLGSMYRYFEKDVDKTVEYMEKAISYFESKKLTYTPHTLDRNKEMMNKWTSGEELEVSARRKL